MLACHSRSEDKAVESANASFDVSNNPKSNNQVSLSDTLKYCIQDTHIGAGGYDLVNYHLNNQAALGDERFQVNYDGVIYEFLSDDHKSIFQKDPEKYLPAYGGWCSMTLAMGRATTPTYDNFKIIDGQLHLFERTISINGQQLWIRDPESNAQLAEKNYLDYIDDGVIVKD